MTTRARAGFTLVEILVVVAIIALLAAISLPATQTIRSSSLASRCGSVQRQIFAANVVYADDWRGAMVATYAPNNGAWVSALATMADADGNGQLWTLLRGGCPDWKNSSWFNHPWKNSWWNGYCRNPYLQLNKRNPSESNARHDILKSATNDGFGFTNTIPAIWAPNVATQGRWGRFAEITYPSERIWLGDGIDYYYNWTLSTGNGANHNDQSRHRGRSQFVFADGHTERRVAGEGSVAGITLNR